jgi:hypothetical protein
MGEERVTAMLEITIALFWLTTNAAIAEGSYKY